MGVDVVSEIVINRPRARGGFCVGVSRDALRSAGAEVGDEVELSITPVPRV